MPKKVVDEPYSAANFVQIAKNAVMNMEKTSKYK